MGVGAVMYSTDLREIEEYISTRVVSPNATSIYAEFLGLEAALSLCLSNNNNDVKWKIWCDNKYVIDSFYDKSLVKKPHLIPVMERCHDIAKQLKYRIEIKWVPGKNNADADAMSRAPVYGTKDSTIEFNIFND